MEAPPESFAYTLLLSPDFSKPDALAVIDVKHGSPTYSQVVHTVVMPNKGDEFHHFGWNACSSALSPLTGHAFLERRYLIIPGMRSSRIYIVDTKPDPTKAKIHKIIEPEEIFKKTGYSRPHTIHCGPEGIYVSTLGGGGKDGTDGPPGVFIMERRTSCLQSNVDFLQKTINKLNSDHQQKLDAANRQIEGLKGSVIALQKVVDDLQKKMADDQKKAAAPPAKDGAKEGAR